MLFYLTLLFTSLAMLMVLALVFFANKLRRVLKAQLYHRVFSFFALLAVGGMLLATVLSFSMQGNATHAPVASNAVMQR